MKKQELEYVDLEFYISDETFSDEFYTNKKLQLEMKELKII